MWKNVIKDDPTQQVYVTDCATILPPELPDNFTDNKLGGVIEDVNGKTPILKGLFFDIHTCQDDNYIYIIHAYPDFSGSTWQVFRHKKLLNDPRYVGHMLKSLQSKEE
tara:strand:- start:54 stop:377 length:324 start_codon:yes stop_codon:yes gene_type:complete